MNYIRQLNSFWRWRREHTLPASAQLLWYTLTTEQNQRIWPEEFEISTSVLRQQMGGISINAFRRARNALVRAGLLQATMAANGGEISRFHLTQLYIEKKKSSADRSADPSANPSPDPSGPSDPPPNPDGGQVQNLKPQNVKPEGDKPGSDKPGSGEKEDNQNGRTEGSRLAGDAGPVPKIRPRSAAGAGRSRSRPGPTDWQREQERGL